MRTALVLGAELEGKEGGETKPQFSCVESLFIFHLLWLADQVPRFHGAAGGQSYV